MATAFMAMNKVFGPVFDVDAAEAADMDAAGDRKSRFKGQFIFDDQTHFIRDDFKQEGLLGLTKWAEGAKVNPNLMTAPMNLSRYKMDNYLKEIFLDSETTVSLLSGAPFDDPSWWLLSNDAIANAYAFRQQNGRYGAYVRPHRDHAEVSELDGRSRSRHRQP